MTNRYPAVAYSVTLRVSYDNVPGRLGVITTAIGEVGGDIGAIDIVSTERGRMVRDITVNARNVDHGIQIATTIKSLPGVRVRSVSDPTFLLHLGGKISMLPRCRFVHAMIFRWPIRPGWLVSVLPSMKTLPSLGL